MRIFFHCIALLCTFLLQPAVALAQSEPSLAELARRHREAKKAKARVLTTEDLLGKSEPLDYPRLGLQFGVPRGWGPMTPEGNAVRTACPGFADAGHDPQAQEKDRCGLYVASDGIPSRYREDPRQALENFHSQILQRGREIVPWREFEFGGTPAAEHTLEFTPPREPRRARIIYLTSPDRKRIFMLGLIGEPEALEKFAPVLDAVLATLRITDTAPAGPK
jgi:hypothetical protein